MYIKTYRLYKKQNKISFVVILLALTRLHNYTFIIYTFLLIVVKNNLLFYFFPMLPSKIHSPCLLYLFLPSSNSSKKSQPKITSNSSNCFPRKKKNTFVSCNSLPEKKHNLFPYNYRKKK